MMVFNPDLPGGSVVKTLPDNAGDWGKSLGQKDPWRRKWQTSLIFLSGKIPWTEEPGGLQSMGSQIDMTEHACTCAHTPTHTHTQTHTHTRVTLNSKPLSSG